MAFERAPMYLLKPYLDTLGLEMDVETGDLSRKEGGGAKIVGFSRDGVARVSRHDNLDLQVRTAERLADRFYGKPRSAPDLASNPGNAIVISIPQDRERFTTVARVLVETGAIPHEAFGNGNGDPHAIESSAVEVEND